MKKRIAALVLVACVLAAMLAPASPVSVTNNDFQARHDTWIDDEQIALR